MPLPTPNRGESQDAFMTRCMKNKEVKKDFKDEKQAAAVCFSQFRESNEKLNWKMLEFSMPITENAEINDDFLIRGTAINETTTHNNHKYIAEELERAAPSLIGKPLLVDHNNTVESIKGKVLSSHFDSTSKSIKFEAKVMDKQIREMIKDGRISNVSIGAFADDLIKEEETGNFIAKGLNIVELSLVAVPADSGATFASAFDNNYKVKESLILKEREKSSLGKKIDERGYGEMTEELKKQEKSKVVESSNETNKLIESLQTEKSEKAKLLEELNTLKEEKRNKLIAEYKELCKEKKVAEKDVTKVSEETINLLIEQLKDIKVVEEKSDKKELKAVVSEELEKEIENFVVEKSGQAVWILPNVEKWRRLHSNLPMSDGR